jgi:hypothetical protein
LGKFVHALTGKSELFPTIQKPDKTPKNPKFSEVIAIMGNRGLPAAFFVLFDVKPMPKKQSP